MFVYCIASKAPSPKLHQAHNRRREMGKCGAIVWHYLRSNVGAHRSSRRDCMDAGQSHSNGTNVHVRVSSACEALSRLRKPANSINVSHKCIYVKHAHVLRHRKIYCKKFNGFSLFDDYQFSRAAASVRCQCNCRRVPLLQRVCVWIGQIETITRHNVRVRTYATCTHFAPILWSVFWRSHCYSDSNTSRQLAKP